MHNATTKPRKQREANKTYKANQKKSAIKRGNKPQAPLASEQKCLALAVW